MPIKAPWKRYNFGYTPVFLSLTPININPSMDKSSHAQESMEVRDEIANVLMDVVTYPFLD